MISAGYSPNWLLDIQKEKDSKVKQGIFNRYIIGKTVSFNQSSFK